MNRLLITEIGDSIRSELKREASKTNHTSKSNTKIVFPDIKTNFGSSVLFVDMEKTENPLYQKSLSDQALINLAKLANLSLYGKKSKEQLQIQIRDDLNIKQKPDYLNVCLEKCVDQISDDTNLKSKRKRLLLNELKRLEAKEKLQQFNHPPTDISQFGSIVEETDREAKLMHIVNAEGKLLQIQRRHQQKLHDDEKLKQQIAVNYSKFKDGQIMHIEALPILSKVDMQKATGDIFNNKDQTRERFHQRLVEKHVKEKQSEWKHYHFPQKHKRWLSK